MKDRDARAANGKGSEKRRSYIAMLLSDDDQVDEDSDDKHGAADAEESAGERVDFFGDDDDLNEIGDVVGGASLNELGAAHEELLALSEALSTKAEMLSSREKALRALEAAAASERTRQSIANENLEQRTAALLDRERAADDRARQEADTLAQDLKLAEQRLRLRFEEEAAEREAEAVDREVELERRCELSGSRLREAREVARRAEDKAKITLAKMAEMQRRVSDCASMMEELRSENEKLKLDLDTAKKKNKVQHWKFEKHLIQQQDIAAQLGETQRSASQLSVAGEELQESGSYLLLLIDGLAQLVAPEARNSREIAATTPRIAYPLFVHSLLPGLCHALALNELCGTPGTCKRLLVLILHCVSQIESLQKGTSKSEEKKLQGLVDRFASRLLRQLDGTRKRRKERQSKNASVYDADKDAREEEESQNKGHLTVAMLDSRREKSLRGTLLLSDDAQVRCLSAMASLCVHQLRTPLEPASIVTALVALADNISDPQCQQLVHLYPVSIEPVLLALRYTAVPAWRICVNNATKILFQLAAKGPFQSHFVSIVAKAPSFYTVCLAVLDALKVLGRPRSESSGDLATTSEAASLVSVFLQRLSTTGVGKGTLSETFRQTDLVGTLQECVRVANALQGGDSEYSDALQFFAMNANAICQSLKMPMRGSAARGLPVPDASAPPLSPVNE